MIQTLIEQGRGSEKSCDSCSLVNPVTNGHFCAIQSQSGPASHPYLSLFSVYSVLFLRLLHHCIAVIFSSSACTRRFSSGGPKTLALLPQLSTQRVISSRPERSA